MAIRTGQQFLEDLKKDGREIWLDGELVKDVTTHPAFKGAAKQVAKLFDLQHEFPEIMTTTSSETGERFGITHLIPRSKEDIKRIRKAMKIWAEASVGLMGRSPDYMNVTFACFAGHADVWARRGNEQGAQNLINYQKYVRDNDLIMTHSIINPQVDRSVSEAEQGGGEISLHKVGETEDSIIVRGARMLATLAPFADELTVYPGSDIRLQDRKYAICFAVPMNTPGLKFICRDSYSKDRNNFDYPLSSRFDEMDAVVIFDDVHVPKDRVFMDGDTIGYSEVIGEGYWRNYIILQAMNRALTKLEFAFGLGHMIADTTGVNTFDHVQEKLGEIWNMMEMTRAGVIAAEEGAFEVGDKGVWAPNDQPLLALRGLMPKWIPRATELLKIIGGGGFMLTPTSKDLNGPLSADIAKYYQARNADAEKRIRLFRLGWDFIGSDLAGRGDLYERFYLSDSFRMTALNYKVADKTHPEMLVKQFLQEPVKQLQPVK
ncbi:4-hydroxyphenylacetate 3-hydroxylase family protein [Aneurinibacillus aneurinilyticus]|jgi:4-hydroxyphenylacetate 3-monooxygenase oxygenase component|uniref:4-hydroxyphenylacetate 3-hydroxylase n=2 Tax=Aneurinibacillus aneurinilyticus TaxID=1391 RepID=A0A848D3Q2_ANEAE|nr:4-hydroxyphenylacetate 3-hydroxylase N-terminal domain-containing protein [Aneurinibacillus aneurinilyticus]ERI07452.1 putative 4-hydroxyphenylacetate 3-monooxygenase, oxygenase component [Aneurinibacillus aneurinilyticus ATCC 12856]MCI1696746.1 4-hydroxyphenylacetate 3-monooxygenase, oxygenase component [Aneurinibacillus aneurinilyticus]MED0672263.1 4-hydroxyphenylacetate 3-hydroxylase N-terminal domain-containing protein [Aneurinibacillus aneurinilyticus]MED0705834.1 4-hydroxyphenylacetate